MHVEKGTEIRWLWNITQNNVDDMQRWKENKKYGEKKIRLK